MRLTIGGVIVNILRIVLTEAYRRVTIYLFGKVGFRFYKADGTALSDYFTNYKNGVLA